MEDTIYDQVNSRLVFFSETLAALKEDRIYSTGVIYDYEFVNRLKIISEIDQFVKEYPDTFKKYLQVFANQYFFLFNQVLEYLIPDSDTEKSRLHDRLVIDISFIIEHLNGLLNPEKEIQEQPEPPQKFEPLQPIEKILILHYLKFTPLNNSLLSLRNKEFIFSRLFGINENSIKKPLSKIREYTEYIKPKINEDQAEQFYPVLEKRVKPFFDESNLFEISKVIETRINELKTIAGKL